MIVVGSANPVKINAVRAVVRSYPTYAKSKVLGRDVASGVAEQPQGLAEIVRGALHRAKAAFEIRIRFDAEVELAFGIESGILSLADTLGDALRDPPFRNGDKEDELDVRYHPRLDLCACVVVSRSRRPTVGLSSAWGLPSAVDQWITRENARGRGPTLDDAMVRCGYTEDPRLGRGQGAVGLLSRGRLTRTAYTEEAVLAAMIGLEGRKWRDVEGEP